MSVAISPDEASGRDGAGEVDSGPGAAMAPPNAYGGGVEPSGAGCGCGGGGHRAAAGGGLVFALGQLGVDLVSEARRDSLAQHLGANPTDPATLLRYLGTSPHEAESVTWTLNFDQTPIYALRPAGPFAGTAYEGLRKALGEQLGGTVERVSVPGRLTGEHVRLINGQIVPVVRPELRGFYSWNTGALVDAVGGKPKPGEKPEDADDRRRGIRGFLERVYHELRNLGASPQDRAINYAATNAFQIERVYENALKEQMELDSISVGRSPICRPESDCWEVKLNFFYPQRQVQTVRRVYRFTVDVSDVVPVMAGPTRSWFVR
jgi:cyanobactin maturation PatA/PatG family protease